MVDAWCIRYDISSPFVVIAKVVLAIPCDMAKTFAFEALHHVLPFVEIRAVFSDEGATKALGSSFR